MRHKTRERNEDSSEVVFPITSEIQKILNKYANKSKLGERVFPIMSKFITPEQKNWVVQRYNKYIRKHVAIIAELLKMKRRPSPTWACHSFATNLNNTGHVPYKYISDSMGHSSSSDVTLNYIGTYPLEKMIEYNTYLLHDIPSKNELRKADRNSLIEMLKGLSDEEKKVIVSALSE